MYRGLMGRHFSSLSLPPSLAPSLPPSQGDNIITWTEPGAHGKDPYDMALSFQDEQGCRHIW
jgi:hypothetical protein